MKRLSNRRVPPRSATSERARKRAAALRRERLPQQLYKAAEFSRDLRSTWKVVPKMWQALAAPAAGGILQELRERTTVRHDVGRPRHKGDWVMLYAFYVMSGQPRLTKFCDDYLDRAAKLAGFEIVPSYQSVWLRFSELEQEWMVAAIDDAADAEIRLAKAVFPQIGENIFVDGTAFHSRARLHPLDEDDDAVGSRTRRRRVEGATDDLIKERRHEESSLPEDQLKPSEEIFVDAPPESRYPRIVLAGGKPYGCLDPTAGIRLYNTRGKTIKCWIGGTDLCDVDHFTGIPVANVVISANTQEYHALDELMARHEKTFGRLPTAFTGDKGLSNKLVFRWATDNDVEAVLPFRLPNGSFTDEQDYRCAEFDEHTPRCRHCQGPTTTVGPRLGMQKRNGKPRLYFRCELQLEPGCASVQSLDPLANDDALRRLTVLSPLTERFHALIKLHSTFERTHKHQRERYGKSGSDQTGKLKRFGIPAQRLRSAMCRLLEWFRFCYRWGILGDNPKAVQPQILTVRGTEGLERLMQERMERGLDLPYGPTAYAAGWAMTAEIPPPVRNEPRGSPAKKKPKKLRNR